MPNEIIYKEESYRIIGLCMEIHRTLGHGFTDVVYKDALEVAFRQEGIPYRRNREYKIEYRGEILPHTYSADFVAMDKIILEIKCVVQLTDEHISKTINFLKVSGNKLGLLINFARQSLEHKRLVF